MASSPETPTTGPGPSQNSTRENILSAFSSFRAEIDDYNDRRERLIKISRDITIQSKRLIFSLHRIANEDADDAGQRAVDDFKKKLRPVYTLFEAAREELKGQDFWRYAQSLSARPIRLANRGS